MGVQASATMLGFFSEYWGLNWGLHAYETSTLLIKLFLSLLSFLVAVLELNSGSNMLGRCSTTDLHPQSDNELFFFFFLF